jgi:putative ABC transport system ATP-binding protein
MSSPSPLPGRRQAAIRVQGLNHRYRTPAGEVLALRDVNLEVPSGGYVALMGPSGAGKSTFLSLLGGLEPMQVGSIRVGDRELAGLAGDDLAAYRRETVGFVFQHYGLVSVLSAVENVELSLVLTRTARQERRRRALELLDAVGLTARRDHRPAALSGGERQRVAIARAIANRPRLLLADEPTGNLDEESTGSVLDLLGSIRDATGCTLVVVTHNHIVANRALTRRRLVEGRWVA